LSRTRSSNPGRGLVILVVLVVVTLSALIGSSVLLMGDHARASTSHDRRSAQARLAAWSGVQAVMSRLHAQRDELLDGVSPVLPESWTFPIEEGSSAPAFRVVGASGQLAAVSENAKLDVNMATVEMLESLTMVSTTLARAIVDARPFGSIGELGGVPGVTPALMYPGAGEQDTEGSGEPGTLSEVLTVFAFDPNIQLGEGDDGEEHRGNRRVYLGPNWSDDAHQAVVDRWDESAAQFIEGLFEEGERLNKTSDVVALMRRFSASPEGWVEALDAVTTVEGEHVRGLVDLNRAPAVVLAAIPGIDETGAHAIVDLRDRLGLDQRRSIAWPAIEGILTEDELQEASDWLTTRSTQWRVRVEGGVMPAGGPVPAVEGEQLMLDRVVYDCVIDVSSRRPRVAYLRDVSAFDIALAMQDDGEAPESETLDEDAERESDAVDGFEPSNEAPHEDDVEPAGEAPDGPEEPMGDLADGDDLTTGRIGRWTVSGGDGS